MKIKVIKGVWEIVDYKDLLYYDITIDEKYEIKLGTKTIRDIKEWNKILYMDCIKTKNYINSTIITITFLDTENELDETFMIYNPVTNEYVPAAFETYKSKSYRIFNELKHHVDYHIFEIQVEKKLKEEVEKRLNDKKEIK